MVERIGDKQDDRMDYVLEDISKYWDWYERVRTAILTRKLKTGVPVERADVNLLNWKNAKANILNFGNDYLPNVDTTKDNLQTKLDKGVRALKTLHRRFRVKMYHTHYVNGKFYSHPIARKHTLSSRKTKKEHKASVQSYMKIILSSGPYVTQQITEGVMFGFKFNVKDGRLKLRSIPVRTKKPRVNKKKKVV